MGGGVAPTKHTKTVVVLGVAYGGTKGTQMLAEGLPEDWRLIAIDRNSHSNHVYVLPRFAVLPGHEYKAFIPYTNVFLENDKPKRNPNHIFLKTEVTSIRPNHITISQPFPELGIDSTEIAFDYALYALGAHLPAPMDLWGRDPREDVKPGDEPWTFNGFKNESCKWLQERQKAIEAAPTVLVVGGGALGIQFATDIKAVHPEKGVTLLHSRQQLLPRFSPEMHDEVRKAMELQGIDLILGERLDLSAIDPKTGTSKAVNAQGKRIVRTEKGREIAADLLLLCTGQKPNTGLLKTMDPSTINSTSGQAYVQRTMQLSNVPVPFGEPASPEAASFKTPSEASPYPNIFVVGDSADAFGAIQAGHTAYYQSEVAAKNILKLVKGSEEPLEHYAPGPPAIKVSLGLTRGVVQVGPEVTIKTDGVPDLHAPVMWPVYGIKVEKDEDMRQ
ncbi:FAD/NAD(P)-binding domain-containing protein [Coprinellus micaceus]|uniref:FAD/NAD(P)-binding domain-containing protein n=1 Tax=Coprinellus micaceus TaxID=71717 RepID=A0A4Y7SVV9_COPMI|nr:FAD/NAD(P)-binding domain-containing protein [Coprinellus micaceus]